MTVSVEREILARQDLSIEDNKLWLSGFFGIGGQIGFIQCSTNPLDFTPYIGKADQIENHITTLKKLFGGGKYPQAKSWNWRIYGPRAAEIIIMLGPFLPAHADIVGAAIDWKSCQNPAERCEVAFQYKESCANPKIDGVRYLTLYNQFQCLIESQKVTAGSLDNRISLNRLGESTIYSKNRPLAQALADKFDGNSNLLEQFDKGKSSGKIYRSARVDFGRASTKKLVQFAYPELLLIKNQVSYFFP